MGGLTAAIDSQRYAADFRKADADSSGSLGREEVMKYLAAKGMSADEAYLDELIGVFDTDGSGEIDAKEFTGLVRLMMSHERSLAKAKAAGASASAGAGDDDDDDDDEPPTCFGQPCSPFCGLMVCGIITVIFLMILWPVSVTSCTDGQSTRAAADQGLAPPDGDRRRSLQADLIQGPVDTDDPPPTPPPLPAANFVPVSSDCSAPHEWPRVPYLESRCVVGAPEAGQQSEFHCLSGGSCVDVPPSVCSASGDPHYTSFDGKRFDFMGTGDFWLVQSPRIRLQGRHVHCNGVKPTCFTAFAVAICDGSVPTAAGRAPCSTWQEWPDEYRQEASVDVQIPANCVAQGGEASCKIHIKASGGSFRIKLPGMYYKQTDGICGDFDTDPDNDGGFCTSRDQCNQGTRYTAHDRFRVRDEESLFTQGLDRPGACVGGTGADCFSESPTTCSTDVPGVPVQAPGVFCAPHAAGWESGPRRTALTQMLEEQEEFVLNTLAVPDLGTKIVLDCHCDPGRDPNDPACGHDMCENRVNIDDAASFHQGCFIAVTLCEHGLTDINACVDDMCEGLVEVGEGVIEAAHEIAIEMGNEPDPVHYSAAQANNGGWTTSTLANGGSTAAWPDPAQNDPCDASQDDLQSRNPCTRSTHGACVPYIPPATGNGAIEIGPEYECLCDAHWHTSTDPGASRARLCDMPGEHPNFFHMHEAHNYGCDCPAGYEGVACEKFLNPCEADPELREYLNGPSVQPSTRCPPEMPQCYAFGPPDGPVVEENPDDPTAYYTLPTGVDPTTNEDIFPATDPGYQCGCPRGYKGPSCDIVIEECCSSPCPEGNFCVEGPIADGAFSCRPPGGLSASAEAIAMFVEDVACTPGVGSLSPLWALVLGAMLACCCLHRKHAMAVPAEDDDDDIEEVAALAAEPDKEEFTMWILFILDPSGVRHACEVMSSEWNIDTIYEKALAATGIPIAEQVLTFGGRTLKPGKKLTSYGVQHGSEIVLKTKSGAAVQSRQGKVAANRREIKVTRGKQSI
jgi:hypothetical protein